MENLFRRTSEKIRSHLWSTPLQLSHPLSQLTGGRIFIKPEFNQRSGSFKIRGVLSVVLSHYPWSQETTFVTASTGNHAAAVAEVLNEFGLKGKIFLPRNAAASKLEHLKSVGADIVLFGDDCLQTEVEAADYAASAGAIYISPYNDELIVAGQGTIAVEILEEIQRPDVILCPVGGGGLVSGVAAYAKSMHPEIRIIGTQPENSPVMCRSVEAGEIIEMESLPTLSDATAGGIAEGSITFDYCSRLVDEFSLLKETEIRRAIRYFLRNHQTVIEGAAALPISIILRDPESFSGQTVVAILTGKKLPYDALTSIVCPPDQDHKGIQSRS